MQTRQFHELCRDTLRHLGADDVDAIEQGDEIEVDGVAMALHHDEDDEPDCIFCYVDLGLPESAQRLEVWEHLLALNLTQGSRSTCIYSRDPESGHAVACLQIHELDALDTEGLAARLQHFAQRALEVRAEVIEPPAPQGVPPVPTAHTWPPQALV